MEITLFTLYMYGAQRYKFFFLLQIFYAKYCFSISLNRVFSSPEYVLFHCRNRKHNFHPEFYDKFYIPVPLSTWLPMRLPYLCPAEWDIAKVPEIDAKTVSIPACWL
jgi:hypothetical protein